MAGNEIGPRGTGRARLLRRRMTAGEHVLWRELRGTQMGVSFRRQHPVSGLVVDFYSPSVRLALELDGPIHNERQVQDANRDEILQRCGIRVLRLQEDDVIDNLSAVLDAIHQAIAAASSKHVRSPSPERLPPFRWGKI